FTYLEQALAMAEQQEAKLSICVLLSIMGKNLAARGDYENALDHYLRSLKLKDEIDDQVGKIYLLANISRLYIETERYREAEQHLTQALALVNALGYTGARANVMSTMAHLYHSKGDHAKAIKWGQETIGFSKKDKNLEILTDIYDIMASSYAAIDKPEEAYEYRTLYAIERDSFHQQQQQENVEQLRLAYEVEKTEKENNALKLQAEKDQIMLRQQNLMMIGAVLGLLLLALVIGLIYRDLKRKQQYSHELEATVAQRTAELQRANEDLEQVNYELTGFTYIASHDIKEPIRVINSYVGLIQSRLPEQVGLKLKDYFEIIRASGQQLYTLIEDFMQYSSLSREDSSQADEIELPLLVENLIKGLDVSEKVSVKYEGVEQVCLNQSMLFLILKNLVENGLKYNQSEHPEILIFGKKSAGQIEFRVKDNGIGIPAAFQDKIFETFKRLHSREEYLGTGLGLSIVKLAVSKLDGEISLESEEGKGSTFIITCAEASVSDAHV
ncbi:MAG: tetratricopeptide repeat protein, partial [Phaeodactylibacter sp.]|nr:tetratricopeptide repeat protein [Phaeodactylibacter sp.]